jgi:DUF4097 and DUF4098 domain-containing protein YvlB
MRSAILMMALACAGVASAQIEDKSTERKTFTGARELIIDNVSGNIEVSASTGATVEVEVEKSLRARSQDRIDIARKEISLAVKQDGGLVQLMVDGPFRCHCADNSINFRGRQVYDFSYNFKVRVPRDLFLELRTVNDAHILVEGTSGDYKISNVNGGIEMRDVEGSGTVNTVNGGVKVSYARNPKAATSFKSVNGTLDVTFRGGLNADARMKTMNGGLFTDFPVTTLPAASTLAQPERRDGGFVWKSNRMTGVRIGSGGPELSFETLNGNVLIKNREK